MAKDLIQVTHGLKADLPQLMPGEIGFCTDTEEAFIGNGDGNANVPFGAKGEQGVTYTPYVSDDGTLSWTNDGGLPNPDPVNIKGDTGATGPAATVTNEVSFTTNSAVSSFAVAHEIFNMDMARTIEIAYLNEGSEVEVRGTIEENKYYFINCAKAENGIDCIVLLDGDYTYHSDKLLEKTKSYIVYFSSDEIVNEDSSVYVERNIHIVREIPVTHCKNFIDYILTEVLSLTSETA